MKTDLQISGHFHIIEVRQSPYSVIATTRAPFKKGEAYKAPVAAIETVRTSVPSTTRLYHSRHGAWITAYAPVKGIKGDIVALLALDSDETPFLFRLLGYGLHYFLLAVGLTTLGGFLYIWNSGRSQRSLESARNRYFTLFKESKDGILIVDRTGRIERANASAIETLELTNDHLKRINLFDLRNQELTWMLLDNSSTIQKTTIEKSESFRARAKLILRGNKMKYISFSSSPMIENQETVGAIVIFQDITADTVRVQEIQASQVQLREENLTLQQQVITDPLTHCLNKQYLQHFLDQQNLKWVAYEGCSMLLIDLDNFKAINDTKGHLAGDQVLQSFSQFLKSFFRKTDKIIRYGGDEFMVLLPHTDLKAAARIGNNMLDALRKLSTASLEQLTVSVGIAELHSKESGKEWLTRADAALYDAKNAGKNRLQAHSGDELEILN
jgi:diguanylate cyclase (GGDEF)-like protein/PAS domain S-box-containing protein